MSTQPNPYAAPNAQLPSVQRRRRPVRHHRLKHYYLACVLAPFPIVALSGAAPALATLSLLTSVLGLVVLCLWLHRSWALLPARFQRGTTPEAAVLYNFVPGWNLIWQFVANQRVVASLSASLAKYPTNVRPPSTLAIVGPALSALAVLLIGVAVLTARSGAPSAATALLPFVVAAPFVWFAWMSRVDRCFEEITFQRAAKKKRSADDALRERDS